MFSISYSYSKSKVELKKPCLTTTTQIDEFIKHYNLELTDR